MIKERALTNQAKPISIEEMAQLLNITRTHIIKIYCKNGGKATGFFCNIPIDSNNYLKVLITNNHVLMRDDIKPGQTIKFSLNKDLKFYNILIDNSRKIYTNQFYDVTIIEIKDDDKIDKESFFDIDETINQKESIYLFKNEQIFLLHYPRGAEMEVSNGIIKNINEDDKTIYHSCCVDAGSSGSPIVNKKNFKVIGIHNGSIKNSKYNLGILLKEPIEEFIKKNTPNMAELKNKIEVLEKDKKNLENRINELMKENMKIKEYKKEINLLKNKLEVYEKDNEELKNKIKNLNKNIDEKKKIFPNNDINNNKDKIIELMEELKIKEKEIKDIKSVLPFELKKNDKLLSVIFFSVDQKIHYSLICKNTDKFSRIEEKLFEAFPDCQEENYYFMYNGCRINRYKTLEELNIKNSSIITMNVSEFE